MNQTAPLSNLPVTGVPQRVSGELIQHVARKAHGLRHLTDEPRALRR